jgi:hypothetical protein
MNEQKIKINNIDDSIKTNENNEIKFQTNDARDKKYVTKNEMLKNKILATLSIPILEWGFQTTSWAPKTERSRDIAFYIPESRLPTERSC